MRKKKIDWRKGNGEFIGFAIIAIVISSLIIMIAAFIQFSHSMTELTRSANAISRSASVCTSLDDAKLQAQNVAENALKNEKISNIQTDVEFAEGTTSWESNGYIIVTVKADIKTIEPYFTSGTREKKVLVAIEGLNGSTILVPDQYGMSYTYTNYTYFYPRWVQPCRRIADYWHNQCNAASSNGIATINGYYLIACTPKFGVIGDVVRFTLADGTELNCIVADAKNVNDAGCNEWGHDNGRSIVEFELVGPSGSHTVPNGGSVINNVTHGSKVIKCVNYGTYSSFK